MQQDAEVQCNDSRIELELALGFSQTRARVAEETLAEYDQKVEAAVLRLMQRLSQNADDDEISQMIASHNVSRSISWQQSQEAAGAETETQAEGSMMVSLKAEEEALQLAALKRTMKVSMLREMEDLLGPVLQWRHRSWPEDSSYTFVTSTEDAATDSKPDTAGIFGIVARAIDAEQRAATLAIEADVAQRRAAKAEERAAELEVRLTQALHVTQQQLHHARVHSYHIVSRYSRGHLSAVADALHLYIRVSVHRARCYITCIWEWILGVCSRYVCTSPPKFHAPRLIV